jgi:aminopeptidase N
MKLFIVLIMLSPFLTQAQLGNDKNKFTKADTLRGSLNENRDWWDVLRYDIEVKPDYKQKTIEGKCVIQYKHVKPVKKNSELLVMQIDLQQPLIVDSILIRYKHPDPASLKKNDTKSIAVGEFRKVFYERNENIIKVDLRPFEQYYGDSIMIYYHGKPKEAKNAPWDGGWIWKTDSLGRPWMSVAVQGLGASAWFPCKDHQSDEPDNGASLTVIVPDTLVAVGNGRLISKSPIPNSQLHSYTWEVKNPINSYNIVPSIGKYVKLSQHIKSDEPDTAYVEKYEVIDTIIGWKSFFTNHWVLDYNLEKAKKQFEQVKPMFKCFEHWFGPYPFYEDGYKLVESPHLGMEHQSAIAYGNKFRNGYLGRDRSGTGWGSKWDFIIIHESGHEWFANNITTKDIADMWVHEGFTNYSETLYTEWLFDKQAGDEYNKGLRKNIQNDKPIIGIYGVNQEGSGDMYDKAGNMIHIIRKVINDDEKFRKILRGMNEVFWHQTVTTQQIENYIIRQSGIDFQKTFDQYLRTIQIPQLEFYLSKDNKKITYRWTNSIKGFDLPLVINNKRYHITTKWKTTAITKDDLSCWNKIDIEKLYYITAKQVSKP